MSNLVVLGDNLEKSKQHVAPETVALITTDPLWKTNSSWLASDDLGTVGYYKDSFQTLENYLDFLHQRVDYWFTLLRPGGHMVLHVDADFSAYVRIYVLDKVFGRASFRNTIVWSYKRWAATTTKKLNKLHHDLLWYTKAPISNCVLNEIRIQLDKPRKRNLVDGKTRTSLRDDDGNVVYSKQTDRPVGDVWDDILPVPNRGGERVNYPTQKPLKLSERLIIMLSNEGDLVMDPFMGSGTALVAANNLGRGFIGFDNEQTAFDKTCERLNSCGINFTAINGRAINIKGIDDMSDFEYQEYIVTQMGGTIGPRGADGGIDGVIVATSTGLGVTRSKISRQKIAQFATDLSTHELSNGIFISPISPSREAIREAAMLRLKGHNIHIKLDSEILITLEPKVTLEINGFDVYARTSGFRHTIVGYTWKINENDDQTYLFGSKKKRLVDKHDKTGQKNFSVQLDKGDIACIECIVTDSKGNAIAVEVNHKF